MKKILFIQIMGDAIGGITNVNKVLTEEFSNLGNEVYVYSMRNGGYYNKIEYSNKVHVKILNQKDEWGLIKGKQIKKELTSGHFFKALKLLISRIIYKIKLRKDFKLMKNTIKEVDPDIIINSHYELLEAIPKEYLSKTIMHFHTSFGQVLANKNNMKIFKKYNNMIKKIVWLTKSTCENAKHAGLLNSTYIYNPLRISYNGKFKRSNKIVFVARFSPEKRMDLLVEIFEKVLNKTDNKYELHIYGEGIIDAKVSNKIKNNKKIILHPFQEDVTSIFEDSILNINTSDFEGLSMTVIEAAECGVPTMIFNFGESVNEQVIDNETGFIIEKGNIDNYVNKMIEYLNNEKQQKEMFKNCKEFAINFQKKNIVNNWLKLFGDSNEE